MIRFFNHIPTHSSCFIIRCSLRQQRKAGFTLLEMIISIGIFSVLVVTSLGVTLGVSNAQIKASNIQSTQDNIRFGLELITKEMRTGSQYVLSAFCSSPGQEINFITSSGEGRLYYLSGEAVKRVKGSVPFSGSDCARGVPLMADEVAVERFHLVTSGTGAGSQDGQSRVTISMSVRSKSFKNPLESRMNLETTVVQRLREF